MNMTTSPYTPVHRAAWHAEGLRWIASVFNAAADRIDVPHATPELALQPTPEYKPFEDFLFDARFRVQNEMFLR
jgi:hypothetical protein